MGLVWILFSLQLLPSSRRSAPSSRQTIVLRSIILRQAVFAAIIPVSFFYVSLSSSFFLFSPLSLPVSHSLSLSLSFCLYLSFCLSTLSLYVSVYFSSPLGDKITLSLYFPSFSICLCLCLSVWLSSIFSRLPRDKPGTGRGGGE